MEVDIHRHLGGSLKRAYSADIKTLDDLLGKIGEEEQRQFSVEDFDEALHTACAEAVEEGLKEVHFRFNPFKRCDDLPNKLGLILAKLRFRSPQPKVKVILCMDRSWDAIANSQVLRLAKLLHPLGLIHGIDMAGGHEGKEATDQNWFSDILGLYLEAHVSGLHTTYHIGETSSVGAHEVVSMPFLNGIGHGIHLKDVHLDWLFQYNPDITFEICPTANIRSGVADLGHLRMFTQRLATRNLKWRVCTDNPGVLGTTLAQEVELLTP